MDGPDGEFGRHALVLAIPGKDPGPGEQRCGVPDRLIFADERMRELAGELAAFGYEVVSETLDDSVDTAGSKDETPKLVKDAVDQPGLVVVHLIAHGDRDDSPALYLLGPDGQPMDSAVSNWVDWAERRNRSGHGAVLFVLDVCYAGLAVGYQLNQLADRGLVADNRVLVLAAAGPRDQAYDGRLSRALALALRKFRSREEEVGPSLEFVPVQRLFRAVAELVKEQTTDQWDQHVYSTFVPLHADTDHLGFLPNPAWNRSLAADDALGAARGELTRLLDEVFDPWHFFLRASATEAVPDAVGRGFFHGRAEQLRQLRDWVLGTGPSLRVVTGKPGVGKSALLGVVVCAAHPVLRERVGKIWERPPGAPPKVPPGGLAVVHARRRTTAQIVGAIAGQWFPPATGSRDGAEPSWTVQRLIEELSQSPAEDGRLLVVDAVDEAYRPDELVSGLLVPLAKAHGADDGPLCRMLVAGRDEPHLRPLAAAAADGGLLDLGTIPPDEVRDALTAYLKDVLDHGTHYEQRRYAPAGEELAKAIARALTSDPGADAGPDPLAWGEFLVAGLYLRYVCDLPPVADPAEARTLGEAVPRDLRAVLELDFARIPAGLRLQAQALARALAFTEGTGMPEQVAQQAAAALFPAGAGFPDGLTPTVAGSALEALRFYLRRDVDGDGSILYRLFHQGLADQLRTEANEEAAPSAPSPAARVWQFLHSMVPQGPDGTRYWQYAQPYLLRHAARHASAVRGELEELLQDASFLSYADPGELAPLLVGLPTGAAGGAADAYRASYDFHFYLAPSVRAQILAIDSARFRNPGLARRLSAGAFWQPVWATGESRSAALRFTLMGHYSPVEAVTVRRADDGRDLVVSGSTEGVMVAWDLETGQLAEPVPSRAPLDGLARCVALGLVNEHDVIVLCQGDFLHVWDAEAGELTSLDHGGLVTAIAMGGVPGRCLILSAGVTGPFRIWDAETRLPSDLSLADRDDHGAEVLAVDQDVVVSGDWRNTIRAWDAITGEARFRRQLRPRGSGVTALATGRALGRGVIVVGDESGTLRMLDAVTGRTVRRLVGSASEVLAAAVGRVSGRDVVVSGHEDNTVRVWEVTARRPAARVLTGHGSVVEAVAVGPDAIVSGSYDTTVRVWNPPLRQSAAPLRAGKAGHVLAVATGRVANRDAIVTGCDDGLALVWDAASGEPVPFGPLTHGDEIRAVVTGRIADDDVVVTGCDDGVVRVWDATSDRLPPRPLAGHTSSVQAVALGLGIIVASSVNGQLRVWDAASGEPASFGPLTLSDGDANRRAVRALAVGRLGDRDVIVTGCDDGRVQILDASTGRPAWPPLVYRDAVRAVAVGRAAGRDLIVSAGRGDAVSVWEVATDRTTHLPLTEVTPPSATYEIWVTAVRLGVVGGRDAIVCGRLDGTVSVWDAATLLPIGHQQFPDHIRSLALVGEQLAIAQDRDVALLRVNPALQPAACPPSTQRDKT